MCVVGNRKSVLRDMRLESPSGAHWLTDWLDGWLGK